MKCPEMSRPRRTRIGAFGGPRAPAAPGAAEVDRWWPRVLPPGVEQLRGSTAPAGKHQPGRLRDYGRHGRRMADEVAVALKFRAVRLQDLDARRRQDVIA